MSMPDDIRDYLVSQGVSQAVLHIADLPDEDGPVVSLNQYGGNPNPRTWSGEMPGLQVWCKSRDYEAGDTLMHTIQGHLQGKWFTVNNHRYLYIDGNQAITWMGKDENGRHEFVQNYIVTKDR